MTPGYSERGPRQEAPSNAVNTNSHSLRRRRVLTVEAESRYCYRLSGPQVRGLIMDRTGGKVPVWSHIAKAFTVSERTAQDVIALAELRNYDVVITGPRAAAQMATPPTEQPDRGDLLW